MKRVWSAQSAAVMAPKRLSYSFSISISKASDIHRRQFFPSSLYVVCAVVFFVLIRSRSSLTKSELEPDFKKLEMKKKNKKI